MQRHLSCYSDPLALSSQLFFFYSCPFCLHASDIVTHEKNVDTLNVTLPARVNTEAICKWKERGDVLSLPCASLWPDNLQRGQSSGGMQRIKTNMKESGKTKGVDVWVDMKQIFHVFYLLSISLWSSVNIFHIRSFVQSESLQGGGKQSSNSTHVIMVRVLMLSHHKPPLTCDSGAVNAACKESKSKEQGSQCVPIGWKRRQLGCDYFLPYSINSFSGWCWNCMTCKALIMLYVYVIFLNVNFFAWQKVKWVIKY